MSEKTITVGHLKDLLAEFDDDTELSFSGLDFYRTKSRGPNLVQIEFNQSVSRDKNGKVWIENTD